MLASRDCGKAPLRVGRRVMIKDVPSYAPLSYYRHMGLVGRVRGVGQYYLSVAFGDGWRGLFRCEELCFERLVRRGRVNRGG